MSQASGKLSSADAGCSSSGGTKQAKQALPSIKLKLRFTPKITTRANNE